ncbi:GNAT family N-acetyltransferase [Amylibacter sp. SFDW26]|uniref:GNAT family N-acetyltransferase n=1 Tax=Amylibacter sp. SFDW26 TaxID=2652722 RepID=UPI0012626B17|nr:GNAT family N-acetyltransferase [Amylibacter sp. SFDW26]KAB7615853.1 GNAT family N-acetyltransferase [Amylibacter sp. SFDW26]
MAQIPELETNRLILRAPTDSDAQVYEEFYADGEASKFYGGPLSTSASWDKIARDLGHWHLRGYGQWTLQRKDTGEIIGSCGMVWPTGWPRSELTWWIGLSARRMGFAKEASHAAIKFGYDTLNWELVETHMKDENLAAKALVLALNGEKIAREEFPDGVTRDVYKLPKPSA